MHSIVGRAFDLLGEREEICVAKNRIQFSGADRPYASHAGMVPGEKERTGGIQKGRMDVGILIPVPIRQAELRVPGDFLANLFEVEQVGPVPVEKMRGAVLAKVKPSGHSPVNLCLVVPASCVTGRQALHERHRLPVGGDVSIHFGGTSSQPPSDGPVLDRFDQLFAAA